MVPLIVGETLLYGTLSRLLKYLEPVEQRRDLRCDERRPFRRLVSTGLLRCAVRRRRCGRRLQPAHRARQLVEVVQPSVVAAAAVAAAVAAVAVVAARAVREVEERLDSTEATP